MIVAFVDHPNLAGSGVAFHQAAVARDDPGAVVAKLLAELGAHLGFGHREADRGGKALAQRARGGFHALGMAVSHLRFGQSWQV